SNLLDAESASTTTSTTTHDRPQITILTPNGAEIRSIGDNFDVDFSTTQKEYISKIEIFYLTDGLTGDADYGELSEDDCNLEGGYATWYAESGSGGTAICGNGFDDGEVAGENNAENPVGSANGGENVDGGHVETIADYDDVMAGNVNDGVDEGPGALIDPPFLEDAFKNYVNCSAPLSGSGIPEWENFTPMVAAYDITTTAPFLPPPLDAGTFYGDQLNVNFGSGHSDNSDPTVNNIDVSAILELVEYGVKCSLRNDLRLTLAEYIALTDDADSGSADAVLLGYRTQVAYAVTHNILSFLIHRLELAQLDLSAIVSTDRNAPPQYVRGALDTLIGSYKRKLDSFERKRLQQKDYAQMISKLYNSRGSN
ncbi:MAG: hypothetical protein CFH43_00001, partial [Proteobacteria bacterium]